MKSQSLLNRVGSDKRATLDDPLAWNASLISGVEYVPSSTEAKVKCEKRAIIALWIFLALVIVLSGAAAYLIWAKIHGLI
ncbi:MAG TPA: hypothetical protein VMR33_12780 [Candidatus Baltobacteraceae bacterium]|jgi:hypothetical protein|nr:hypothetical protein [Candidatus Baltobacteraceae bacterium]